MIDRVLDHQPDKLVALKSVTHAEEYLADHFPGFAVLPGVMMLEALVQAGRRLAQDPNSPQDSRRWVLTEVRNIRYGNLVRPGQSLRLEVTVRDRQPDRLELAGAGTVDNQLAVQGRFTLTALVP